MTTERQPATVNGKQPTVTRRKHGWFCWTCADEIATTWTGMQRHIDQVHNGGRIETGPARPTTKEPTSDQP